MAKIGGQHRQQSLHISALTVPGGQVVDREAVPEIMQAWYLSSTCRAMNPGDTTQGVECLLNGAAGKRRSILVRKKERILTFRKVAAPAEGYMGIQHLGKLWSNRDQTAL